MVHLLHLSSSGLVPSVTKLFLTFAQHPIGASRSYCNTNSVVKPKLISTIWMWVLHLIPGPSQPGLDKHAQSTPLLIYCPRFATPSLFRNDVRVPLKCVCINDAIQSVYYFVNHIKISLNIFVPLKGTSR